MTALLACKLWFGKWSQDERSALGRVAVCFFQWQAALLDDVYTELQCVCFTCPGSFSPLRPFLYHNKTEEMVARAVSAYFIRSFLCPLRGIYVWLYILSVHRCTVFILTLESDSAEWKLQLMKKQMKNKTRKNSVLLKYLSLRLTCFSGFT